MGILGDAKKSWYSGAKFALGGGNFADEAERQGSRPHSLKLATKLKAGHKVKSRHILILKPATQLKADPTK